MMVWTVILPLAALISLASAGGRTLSAQESAEFLSLFRRYCSNPSASASQDGNTFYYCKTSDQAQTLNINHDAEINPGETPKQVIFVQPPTTNYIHNVALRGSPGNPQQTDIYVLPQSADHNLQLQDTRSAVEAVKPSLYFLSGDENQNGNDGGRPRPPPTGGRLPGQQGGNGQRPSSPPPGPSNPSVIGIGTGLGNGGGGGGSSGGNGVPQGGYSFYGPPALISPRNQRNIQKPIYRTL